MPPRKRPAPNPAFRPPRVPAKPKPPEVCMFDGCNEPGALFPAGHRCPAHKPDYVKYLAGWLAGTPKTSKETK